MNYKYKWAVKNSFERAPHIRNSSTAKITKNV